MDCMMMLKRWMMLLLAALLLVGGACAETDLPEPEWNPAVVWVVRNGEVKYFVDDDTIMVFCVEYRSPQGEEDAPKCFWLNYQPEGADPWDPVVSIALAPDDHDLIPSDAGDYRLLIRETALREAYETWLAFCADDAQK